MHTLPLVATSLLVASAALAEEPPVTTMRYSPVQSIRCPLGSKVISGYFVTEAAATCVVILMVSENLDPDTPVLPTAVRVRLNLKPGEMAGLDSEEGLSINVTCGEAAKSLTVDISARNRLLKQQFRVAE